MKKSLLSEETKRMQHLAGIISESSATQNTNNEEILSENIFQRISDKIKGAAIDVKSFLAGEEDKTAIFKNAMRAVEFPIGKNVYGLEEIKGEIVKLYRIKIKSINYKTGEADVSVEEKIKGLKDSWVKNEEQAKEIEEDFKKDREKLENTKTEEEVKKWAEKFVKSNSSIKKQFEKGIIAFNEKDVKGIEDFYKKEEEKETAKELNESRRMKQLAGILNESAEAASEANVDALKGVEFKLYPSPDGKMEPSVYTKVKITNASPLEAGASNTFITKLTVTTDTSEAIKASDNEEIKKIIEFNDYLAKHMSNFMIIVRDHMGTGQFTEVLTDYPNPNKFGVEKQSDIVVAINKAFGNVFKFEPKKGYEREFSSLYAKN